MIARVVTSKECLYNFSEDQEAIRCYDHALKIDSTQGKFYHLKAVSFENSEEALACYDKSIEMTPKDDKV
jgi:tetratricopeptide (TPR) repeat protein